MRENRYLAVADSGLEKLREKVFVIYSPDPFLCRKNAVPSSFPGAKIHRIFRIVKNCRNSLTALRTEESMSVYTHFQMNMPTVRMTKGSLNIKKMRLSHTDFHG